MLPWIVAFHVVANLVWVGAVLSAVVAVSGGRSDDRLRVAREIYSRLAIPGFVVSFLFGLLRLGLDYRLYLVTTHFMHAKLLFAVLAIVAHHVVGAKLKRGATLAVRTWGIVFALSAVASAVVAVVKPF